MSAKVVWEPSKHNCSTRESDLAYQGVIGIHKAKRNLAIQM